MKTKLLYSIVLLTILSSGVFSQIGSPILVEPPKNVDVVTIPVQLDWQDLPGAQCYRVEVTNDTTSPNKFEALCNAPDSHYEIPAAETEPNTVYYWRVFACTPTGWSDPSCYFSFKTAATTPAATIGNMIDGVIDLIVEEDIPENQGNILIHRLERAQDFLNQGNEFVSLVNMVLFKARLFILRVSSVITADVYTSLNYSADGVIDLIVEEDTPQNQNVNLEDLITPKTYTLGQNYPNPFNPSTTIEFSIPQSNNVSLKIYDMTGKEVTSLVNEYRSTGSYIVRWNASGVSSGVYFYKLVSGNFIETKKMILTK
ncbi:MAG: T9SS type A sorting domain-containing protein [Ignavibacteria bacterium]